MYALNGLNRPKRPIKWCQALVEYPQLSLDNFPSRRKDGLNRRARPLQSILLRSFGGGLRLRGANSSCARLQRAFQWQSTSTPSSTFLPPLCRLLRQSLLRRKCPSAYISSPNRNIYCRANRDNSPTKFFRWIARIPPLLSRSSNVFPYARANFPTQD